MISKCINTSILTVLISMLFPVDAVNTFLFPTTQPGQSFQNGDTLEVAWTANFTAPVLQLFCSYVASRRFHHPLWLTTFSSMEIAFLNETILDGSKTFPLKLEIGPQPNCYLLLSHGKDSFGTGIFAITASNGTAYMWSQYGVTPASSNRTAANQTAPGYPTYNRTISYSSRFRSARRSG